MKKVYVGLSGGVDSSVTAALLKEQGYDVTGVHMKNWTQDFPGFHCPWKEDFEDAKRVAVHLGIDFRVYDFQKEYKQKVVDYMLDEYQAGRTPNPDIMCNQEVKFRLFLDTALEDGADMIATGHYARVKHEPAIIDQSSSASGKKQTTDNGQQAALHTARDANKDQTYFLYRITEGALQKTLFPLGGYKKSEVRKLADKFGLATASKPDSQGICFVGEVGIKEFLSQYIETVPGSIVDQNGETVGEHDGAIFYTIGQRKGLGVGGGLPYYVTKKEMKTNTVYVTTDLDDKNLWRDEFAITDVHWINRNSYKNKSKIKVRLRHLGALIPTKIDGETVKLDELQRAITPGQSAVFYDGDHCLGGGIVT